jgi:hypothetical protein
MVRLTFSTLVLGLALAAPASGAPPVRATPPRTAVVAPSPPSPLPWIVDDWPRAVALARQRKVPIFVENWAPW